MEEKQYENICDVCSKPFISTDEDATVCPDCWEKIVGSEEGKGDE